MDPNLSSMDSSEDSMHDRLDQMHAAINQLKKVEKGIILLHLDSTPYKEMAEIMGVSESNIGVRINRIKKKLKSIMTQEHE